MGGDAIYMLHDEDGQGLQELEKEIQDAKSKLRRCLYVVIQNPVRNENLTYVGKTHVTVLARDWSKWVGHLYAIVQSYRITPTRLACQQRGARTCMVATRAFMGDDATDTPTIEQLTEKKAMRAFTRIFDACGTLMSCGAVDVIYSVFEDIALFTGIDMCMLITSGSDSKLHECMKNERGHTRSDVPYSV